MMAAGNFLDRANPELVAKYSPGKWLRVSEYGVILGCADTKEQLEQVVPHEGCSVQLVKI